jgi:hypothetical protein
LRFGVKRPALSSTDQGAIMFDNAELRIPCGSCSRETTKTVAWLKTLESFICACGTRTEIDARHFVRELRKVDKVLYDLNRQLERFGC